MTTPAHASPVVSGTDGADLPGVQAGSPCQSVKRGATNNALGGVESTEGSRCSVDTRLTGKPIVAPIQKRAARQLSAGLTSGPSAPFNDCGGVDGHAIRSDWPRRKSGNVVSQAGVESGPQFPLFIAILFAVPMGCVIWAVLLWWLL